MTNNLETWSCLLWPPGQNVYDPSPYVKFLELRTNLFLYNGVSKFKYNHIWPYLEQILYKYIYITKLRWENFSIQLINKKMWLLQYCVKGINELRKKLCVSMRLVITVMTTWWKQLWPLYLCIFGHVKFSCLEQTNKVKKKRTKYCYTITVC